MTPAALEQAAPGRGTAVMRSAVGLATSAAARHAGTVALSLGSFGSTLKPGQEYAGVYPPPFGPDLSASPSKTESSPQPAGTGSGQLASPAGTGIGTTAQQDTACASPAEEALYAFHLERLNAYRDATSTGFGDLAWLAFETVPNLTEIRAIRRAMATLRNEGHSEAKASRGEERPEPEHVGRPFEGREERQMGGEANDARARGEGSEACAEDLGGAADPFRAGGLQPTHDTASHGSAASQPHFWISSAFPAGQLGEAPNGPHSVAEWVTEMIGGGPDYATPDGVGVNCTNPSYLPAILDDIEARIPASVRAKTTLVVYPDGGCVYDPLTKNWTEKTGTPNEWARGVLDVLRGREWKGIIVGGCCKTGPEEIAALRKTLDAQ
ncbi:homocysteine S-methyltransferase [Trichosporon asahii var. asahii CBS 8904]|uniref:Homocysteine S-methyltransferase n=1 Tax=Trichosporon asahii var. asahii (strain CBS 8904) TaxID=1220162 RepID=K1VQD9_TRIAC|nr:homocysteine S-methyltransferase [Trichosporon asahii var. asahii CBS 8904]